MSPSKLDESNLLNTTGTKETTDALYGSVFGFAEMGTVVV
jgi:hypothetical protein